MTHFLESLARRTRPWQNLWRTFWQNRAEEKSEVHACRLEKCIDGMKAILSRHTEEIKVFRSEMANLQERISNTETFAAQFQKNLQAYEAKLTDMEDRARRDNLLIFNLKKSTKGPNLLAYLAENITKWFPALISVQSWWGPTILDI